MDYCMWTSNCPTLGNKNSEEALLASHACCYTCKKKAKCPVACVDRDKTGKCKHLRSEQEIQDIWAPKKQVNSNLEFKKVRSARESIEEHLAKQSESEVSPERVAQPTKVASSFPEVRPKPAKVSKRPLPTTVKELADMAGTTYARANYWINTKKLSYKEALEKLLEKK